MPDLVSKLREALTSINPFSGGRDGDECLWCRRDYPRDCKTMEEYFLPEHHQSDCQLIAALLAEKQPVESVLGLEGQAAPACEYCNALWERKGRWHRHPEGTVFAYECPSPSTPIVPSTPGLSAENIKLKIGSRFYDREPYSGAWDEPFNVACEVLNAALAERPAPAGEVKGEKS